MQTIALKTTQESIELMFVLFMIGAGRNEECSEMGSSMDEINTAQTANPHSLVLSTFETIWNAVNQFRCVH